MGQIPPRNEDTHEIHIVATNTTASSWVVAGYPEDTALNAALKAIDRLPTSLRDAGERYQQIMDGTPVHPEHLAYEQAVRDARKAVERAAGAHMRLTDIP